MADRDNWRWVTREALTALSPLATIARAWFFGSTAPTTTGYVMVKISGVFVKKPVLVKIAGAFVQKPVYVKVSGTFIQTP